MLTVLTPTVSEFLVKGTSPRTTVHCAFKNGFKATGWQVVQF